MILPSLRSQFEDVRRRFRGHTQRTPRFAELYFPMSMPVSREILFPDGLTSLQVVDSHEVLVAVLPIDRVLVTSDAATES